MIIYVSYTGTTHIEAKMARITPKSVAEALKMEHEDLTGETLKLYLVKEVNARLEKLGVKEGAIVEFGPDADPRYADKRLLVSNPTVRWKTDCGLRFELNGRDYNPAPLLLEEAWVVIE